MHDLPLRSDLKQTFGLEKLGTNPSITFNNAHVLFEANKASKRQVVRYNPDFAFQLCV